MDDPNTSEVTRDRAENAQNPPSREGGVVPPQDEKPTRKIRKHNCYRKLRKAQVPIEIVCAIALVVITGTYTYFASKQADEIKDANKITRDALLYVQRAFIFPVAQQVTQTSDGFDFVFVWENSGTTPTKEMTTHVSFDYFLTEPASDYRFTDRWATGAAHVNTPTAVSPRGAAGVHSGVVPMNLMQLIISGKLHIYFWGWAKYHDVFDNTPEHLTKFSYVLVPIDKKLTPNFRFKMDNYGPDNCYDDQCKPRLFPFLTP